MMPMQSTEKKGGASLVIVTTVLGKFLLRKFHLGKVEFSIGGIFHRRNFPGGTFLGGILRRNLPVTVSFISVSDQYNFIPN